MNSGDKFPVAAESLTTKRKRADPFLQRGVCPSVGSGKNRRESYEKTITASALRPEQQAQQRPEPEQQERLQQEPEQEPVRWRQAPEPEERFQERLLVCCKRPSRAPTRGH